MRWRLAAGPCGLLALLALGCTRAPPPGEPTLVREIELPASDLAAGTVVPITFDSAGFRFVEATQSSADVQLTLESGGKAAQVFDAPGRRASSERACAFGERGEMRVRVASTDASGDPAAKVHVRILVFGAQDESALVGAARAECTDARAGLQPEKWTEAYATQRAQEYVAAAGAWAKLGDDTRAAKAHLQAAWMLTRHTSDKVTALREAIVARDSYRRAGNDLGVAQATLLAAIPRWDLAEGGLDERGEHVNSSTVMLANIGEELEVAARAFDAAHDSYFSAEARGEMANNFFEQGRFAEAMRLSADAAARFREARETAAATRMLAKFKVALERSGNYREASAAFDRLLSGRSASDTDPLLADILNNSAAMQSAAGNYDEALPQFVRALQIHAATGDYAGMARSLNGLAATYMRLGLPSAALEYANQALNALRRRPNYPGPTIENVELEIELLAGNAHRALGDLPEARKAHEAAVTYARNDASRAQARLELVRDALAASDLTETRKEIALASTLLGNRKGVQPLQLDLESARAAILGGDLADAQRRLGLLEGKFKAAGARDLELEAVHALADVQLRRHRLEDSLATNDRALQLLAALRGGVGSPGLRARLTALHRSAWQLRVDILGALRDQERDPDRREKLMVRMFAAADQANAGLVQETMSRADRNPSAQEARGVAAEISLREQMLAAIESGRAASTREADLRAEVARLRSRYDSMVPSMRPAGEEKAPHYSAIGMRPDTAILFFMASSRKLGRYLIARDRVLELPPSSVDTTARGNLTLDTLSRELLPSDVQLAGLFHLIVVPDPSIAQVPFAALRRPGGSHEPLIDDVDITQALTLQDALTLARAPDAERRVNLKSVALFFDPVFTPDDPRVKAKPAKASWFPAIARLPGSADEARGIAEQLPKDALRQFSGFTATRDAALSDAVARASVLHFATHAIASDQWPHGSGLLLTGFTEDGRPLNGFVSTMDLLSRRSSTELVVLSACDTAKGDATSSENVASLARAFLGGGARRVIATRWPVNDADTARLMRVMYARLVAGATAPAALRDAQRELIAPRGAAGDSRWAGFVLYERAPRQGS